MHPIYSNSGNGIRLRVQCLPVFCRIEGSHKKQTDSVKDIVMHLATRMLYLYKHHLGCKFDTAKFLINKTET